MRWLQTEYILKGVFLGLLLFASLKAAAPPQPDSVATGWPAVLRVTGLTLAGLAVALGIAAVQKLREGYQAKGRVLAFVIFLLLESPTLVYAGIILGLAAGAFTLRENEDDVRLLVTTVAGGAVLGVLFGALRQVERRAVRLGLSLLLAGLLVLGAMAWLGVLQPHLNQLGIEWTISNPLPEGANLTVFSVQLMLGIPIFYLLTFAGKQEETEVEIGAMSAALGLGLGVLTRDLPPGTQSVAFILPVMVYFMYTMRVLPGLRVFKHVLRGLSYFQIGRFRNALLSFRRALQLDPNNELARQGYWRVHCALDLDHLAGDPQTLALVDLDLCLDRAGSLLVQPPTPERLQEAHRLLDLVLSQRPAMRASVAYWRAVAQAHARDLDRAAQELEVVLDPAHCGADDPQRLSVLFQAWQLALLLHDELRKRVGQPQLAQPGRRMEVMAAVERHMAAHPDDAAGWNLKRMLYQDVTEAEYEAAASAPDQPAEGFDHAYAQQLGLALVGDATRWRRGCEYLRMAARGLPEAGPSMHIQIAQAYQRAGDAEGAWRGYEAAKRAGQAVGPKNLSEEDRHAYYATLKMLGDAASAHGRTDLAIDNYRLYSEYERSGVETLRTLADLCEKKGEVLAALRANEQALQYNAKDPDLLARKDRYYYSVMPEWFRGRPDAVPGGFDLAYCLTKARTLLGARELDLDALDWAQHLADLAYAVKPESVQARVLLARAKLRRGEKNEAVALLDEVHRNRPDRFASSEDEEAWYTACRLLGDLYLQEQGRPDLAVPCFKDFQKSAKSGADTIYKLGQAYEMLGDRAKAAKCYELVTAYETHPLAPDAREALYRLQTAGQR
jgi:tetratricopeptide (TPR) repeat protein